MSLLEGFSDWVMDEVGEQVLPDVRQIRQRFEQRRSQRRRGIDWVIARVTGLDLKLEQYRRGERFVSGVAAAGGREAVKALWQGPWALPTERELGHPTEWVQRVAPQTLKAAG
jgi:putative hydrolase